MQKKIRVSFLQIALYSMIFLIFTGNANATQLQNKKSKLKAITKKISLLRKELGSFTSKRQLILTKLKKTEASLGTLVKTLNQTKSELSKQKSTLATAINKRHVYQLRLNKQKALLAKQTRLIYNFGPEPYLKILLNQQDPEQITRYLQYVKYLNQERSNEIQRIQETVAAIKTLTNKIQKYTNHLKKIHLQKQKQLNAQKHKKLKRQRLLSNTTHKIKFEKKQLRRLYSNKKHLENIIKKLNREAAYGVISGRNFYQMHGKLYWPTTHGKITQTFGQAIAQGHLKSNGIIIRTKRGEKVRAIFPGKIVFADWLRGFGLLIIEQHGSKYMTLYGRNQSLYVKTGQKVKAGQVIATVGNSGGYQYDGLYFEIRYKGKPVNPLRWICRKRH